MKRTLILALGFLGLALAPAVAQQASPMGTIHGRVINPVGSPQGNGTVGLSTGPGEDKYTFQVNADGEYTGKAAPGTYTAVYRDPNTPKDKVVDQFENVKIEAGQFQAVCQQQLGLETRRFDAFALEEGRAALNDFQNVHAKNLHFVQDL